MTGRSIVIGATTKLAAWGQVECELGESLADARPKRRPRRSGTANIQLSAMTERLLSKVELDSSSLWQMSKGVILRSGGVFTCGGGRNGAQTT